MCNQATPALPAASPLVSVFANTTKANTTFVPSASAYSPHERRPQFNLTPRPLNISASCWDLPQNCNFGELFLLTPCKTQSCYSHEQYLQHLTFRYAQWLEYVFPPPPPHFRYMPANSELMLLLEASSTALKGRSASQRQPNGNFAALVASSRRNETYVLYVPLQTCGTFSNCTDLYEEISISVYNTFPLVQYGISPMYQLNTSIPLYSVQTRHLSIAQLYTMINVTAYNPLVAYTPETLQTPYSLPIRLFHLFCTPFEQYKLPYAVDLCLRTVTYYTCPSWLVQDIIKVTVEKYDLIDDYLFENHMDAYMSFVRSKNYIRHTLQNATNTIRALNFSEFQIPNPFVVSPKTQWLKLSMLCPIVFTVALPWIGPWPAVATAAVHILYSLVLDAPSTPFAVLVIATFWAILNLGAALPARIILGTHLCILYAAEAAGFPLISMLCLPTLAYYMFYNATTFNSQALSALLLLSAVLDITTTSTTIKPLVALAIHISTSFDATSLYAPIFAPMYANSPHIHSFPGKAQIVQTLYSAAGIFLFNLLCTAVPKLTKLFALPLVALEPATIPAYNNEDMAEAVNIFNTLPIQSLLCPLQCQFFLNSWLNRLRGKQSNSFATDCRLFVLIGLILQRPDMATRIVITQTIAFAYMLVKHGLPLRPKFFFEAPKTAFPMARKQVAPPPPKLKTKTQLAAPRVQAQALAPFLNVQQISFVAILVTAVVSYDCEKSKNCQTHIMLPTAFFATTIGCYILNGLINLVAMFLSPWTQPPTDLPDPRPPRPFPPPPFKPRERALHKKQCSFADTVLAHVRTLNKIASRSFELNPWNPFETSVPKSCYAYAAHKDFSRQECLKITLNARLRAAAPAPAPQPAAVPAPSTAATLGLAPQQAPLASDLQKIVKESIDCQLKMGKTQNAHAEQLTQILQIFELQKKHIEQTVSDFRAVASDLQMRIGSLESQKVPPELVRDIQQRLSKMDEIQRKLSEERIPLPFDNSKPPQTEEPVPPKVEKPKPAPKREPAEKRKECKQCTRPLKEHQKSYCSQACYQTATYYPKPAAAAAPQPQAAPAASAPAPQQQKPAPSSSSSEPATPKARILFVRNTDLFFKATPLAKPQAVLPNFTPEPEMNENIIRMAKKALVLINQPNQGLSCGMRLNPSIVACTAHGVPDKDAPISINQQAPKMYPRLVDGKLDLALLKAATRDTFVMPINTQPLKKGEVVQLIASKYDSEHNVYLWYSIGRVTYTSDDIIATAFLSFPGTSGGYVINAANELVGMHQAANQVTSFFLPASKIVEQMTKFQSKN